MSGELRYDVQSGVYRGLDGPGGRAAQPEVQRLGQSHVATVRERRDDQPAVEPHVLVAVRELARALPDDHVVSGAVPVEAQLRLPRELARCIAKSKIG